MYQGNPSGMRNDDLWAQTDTVSNELNNKRKKLADLKSRYEDYVSNDFHLAKVDDMFLSLPGFRSTKKCASNSGAYETPRPTPVIRIDNETPVSFLSTSLNDEASAGTKNNDM